MANDAMIIAVDRIRFLWPRAKKMTLYAVGIAGDNRGKVLVTEPPSLTTIKHVPRAARPAVWEFGGDGYPIYQRTGGLPDIVVAHLLIVRSRSRTRRAGEIVSAVAKSDEAKSVMETASSALKTAGGLAGASPLNLVLPVVDLIGRLISGKKDKVLQTISGSLFLDAARKSQDSFSDTILSADGNIAVDADAFLFDAEEDEDSVAETREAETQFEADGLLVKAGV